MIFALATDCGELEVFESAEQALGNCEKYDIASGAWAFFAGNGVPLVPVPKPHRSVFGMKIEAPEYTIDVSSVGEGPNLLKRLGEVRSIESGPFPSVEALRAHLVSAGGHV